MCGRYTQWLEAKELDDEYRVKVDYPVLPSWNISPQTFQTVIHIDRDSGRRAAAQMRWGLVPFWSEEPKVGFNSINARTDKLESSPVWREPWRKRRCLIPANSFYEWEVLTDAEKKAKESKPWSVSLKGNTPFAFGGLWDRWSDGAAELFTFAIITVDPNTVLEPFHNRCPLIVEPKDYERWMAPAAPSQLPVDLLRTPTAETMKAWRVARLKGNGPELLNPLAA